MRKLLLIVPCLALLLTGCGKKQLDRTTALELVKKERQFDTVKGSLSTTPDYLQFTRREEEFHALMELHRAGVVVCSTSSCQRGPASDGALYGGGGMGGFTYTAGKFEPSDIVGIKQPTPTTATVQVRLAFQPSPFYSKYKTQLDRLQSGKMVTGFQAESSLQQRTQERTEEVDFELYDDGWRVLSGIRIKR